MYVEVLHLKYWKTYFQRAEWEDDWIDSTVSAARRIWHKYYRPLIKHQTSGMHSAGEDSVDEFGELDAPATSVDCDPFEDFINGAVSDEEAIDHWSYLLAGTDCDSFTPIQALSHMALDFLGAHAGLVVSKQRHKPTADNIQQSTVLGNWLHVGVVPEKALCHKLNTKYGQNCSSDKSEWSSDDDGGEIHDAS
ncbi:hypothetical protein BDP27DRAFT_1429842 [Rhodocollybia butyracea]|uniref:Uncharacterized protein n=1 Tax=Rhodocollybia butyracea TaxID=206335 RepID=A0A9P5U0K1_9AGAR|nr:hypothetical protein BDP27DRAFT_1429842 [Rhodocollybia butyracea]